MGQVIRLNLSHAAYPDASAQLDRAERVLLTAIRCWVSAFKEREDALPMLDQSLDVAGVREAAFSVDALMNVVARTARQPIAIQCPPCPRVSEDEKQLLHAAALAQAGSNSLVEMVLRTALLSSPGAEFALGPLDGIGELFAKAKLFFRQRLPPGDGLSPMDTLGHWEISPSTNTNN